MAQMIYAILAIMLVAIFALNMNRAIMQSENEIIMNEVATQVTGLGTEMIEYIGRQSFDERTIERPGQTYPVVSNTSALTLQDEFGGCTEFTYSVSPGNSCNDIDDYDGLEVTRTVSGLEYILTVGVQYVDPVTHASTNGARTFAKEVEVKISSPHLRVGTEPVTVTMSRVFTYNRHTSTS